MRTVAIEEHFLADGFREAMDRLEEKSARAIYARVEEKLGDLGAGRLKDMDAGGIDLQVISHNVVNLDLLSVSETVRLARQANDQLAAAIAAHPDRFAGFATLPMTDVQAAADELERAVSSLGFKGALISGTTRGLFLDDPSFWPILERAVALDVPIYIHPAVPPEAVIKAYYEGFEPTVSRFLSTSGWGWHSELAIHSLRLILAGVFDRLPSLQIIIGHMGEMIPFMLARIDNTLTPAASNLRQKVSDYFLQNFYITNSGFFTDPPFLLALQTFGADRIIFSVDYPYSSNETGRAFLDHVSLSPADREKISHLNAERLLKLG